MKEWWRETKIECDEKRDGGMGAGVEGEEVRRLRVKCRDGEKKGESAEIMVGNPGRSKSFHKMGLILANLCFVFFAFFLHMFHMMWS